MNSGYVAFARLLLRWYHRHRRDLPWRLHPDAPAGARPDPYHILVSEAMLQQTQVATVIPYFRAFIARLPTVADLAAADEQLVLRLWQGLGYYSRARNLRRAAQQIILQHGGRIPSTVDELLKLPGIGRYTAGAVASIAYDTPAPIVDGNVARVLCRLDAITTDPRQPGTWARLWSLAARIVPARQAGDFNSAMMELGSTVCTPRSPRCLICPIRRFCRSAEMGIQDRIPPPRKSRAIPLVHRWTFCIRRGINGQAAWLIEQRPPRGRWAGLWQFVTVEADGSEVTVQAVRAAAGVRTTRPEQLGTVEHALTHRRYRFDAYLCDARSAGQDAAPPTPPRQWVTLEDLAEYPLSRPQVKIASMLREIPPPA